MDLIESPVQSSSGMVVCPHFLASEVGAQILRQGGNAIDAAIATQAALSVVYPHMTGLGGDAFWLIYDAATQSLYGLNGSGRSAAGASPEFYQQRGYLQIPQRGPLAAITVPGAISSWEAAHKRFGQLGWADLLIPAIELATKGYPVSGSQVYWTRRNHSYFQQYSPSDCPFLPKGKIPHTGELLTNPALAQMLQQLVNAGAVSFYTGAIAGQIVDYLTAVGGLLTRVDFAEHQSDWVTPLETTYRGYRVAQLPPNSQGFTVLQMLNLIEPFDLPAIKHGTADYYHLMIEATKLAFEDRDRWLTDPNFAEIPIQELIAKEYADHRRQRLQFNAAQINSPPIGGDTVYTAIVDQIGNAVSVIQSVYFDFGSAVVVPGTGFVLQNRGCFFSLNAKHINVLAPCKRTFHTLMPGMVRHPDGKPYLILGTMGGEGQPQIHLALLTRLLDFGFNPQSATNAPRWLWGRTWGETESGLTLEGRIPTDVQQALSDRGHLVTTASDWTEKVGHAHVIRLDQAASLYEGGYDLRSDGAAKEI